MKKSLVLLAGASLAFLGLPAVSHAQAASGPFADVPTDHWAYQSVDTLQKAGIVIGYPDGSYGGRRPMTRYEFAVAIARLMGQLKPDLSGYATKGDLNDLSTRLTDQIAANSAALDALRTLVNGFQTELTALGQNVADLRSELNALNDRVTGIDNRVRVLEDENQRFHVNGELNTIFEADAARRRDAAGYYVPFLDKNGVYQGGGSTSDRLFAASDVYEDFLLKMQGKLTDTATANVDLDFGNYLSQVGNTAAFPGYAAGGGPSSELHPGTLNATNEYANIYKAYLDAAVKLGPLGGAELLVGRTGNQFTKYTLMQVDADVYTNLPETDSGDVIMDGAQAKLKAGPANVSLFAGKDSAVQYSEEYGGSIGVGPYVNPYMTGGVSQLRPGGLIPSNHAAALDEGVGARATIGAPEGAILGATVEEFGLTNNGVANGLGPSDGLTDPNKQTNTFNAAGNITSNGQYNRLSIYGVDFNGALPFGLPGVKKGGVLIDASYTVSAHGFNQGFNNVGDNFRYQSTDDQAGFALGPVHVKGGYQYIGPQFSAPGYWGKVGSWTNPTNVRGPVVSAKYAITPKLALDADGEFYKAAYGSNGDGTPINSPLHQGDHLNRYQAGLSYGLSSAYDVGLGYENVQYDLRDHDSNLAQAGKPTESYVSIGIGHSFSPNASLKLEYQIVHYDDKHTNFDPTATAAGGKEDGGVAVGQFQLKF